MLLQRLLRLIGHAVGALSGFDHQPALPVPFVMFPGLRHHLLELFFRKTARSSDGDVLLLTRRLVLRRHLQDTIGIELESDLDLCFAPRCGRNAVQSEASQDRVLHGHDPLTLDHHDLHTGLVVLGRGENLALADRDGGIAPNERTGHAAPRLDTQRQGRDINEQYVLDLTDQGAGLNPGSQADRFLGIDIGQKKFPEDLMYLLLHCRHSGLSSHQNDLVDVESLQASVGHGLPAGGDGSFDQVLDQLFHSISGENHVQMLGALRPLGDVRKTNLGQQAARKLDLGVLGRLFHSLPSLLILSQVNALFSFKPATQPLHNTSVEVIAAQVGIPVGGEHFEDTSAKVQN